MDTNLCIDIGNSRIKMAILENDQIRHFGIFEHQLESEMLQWLSEQSFDKGIYASVIKTLPDWFLIFCKDNGLVQLDPQFKVPLNILYETPISLGSDRIAAMTGAISLYPNEPIFIVNAGTCITYDFVNEKHQFFGGNIAPGLDMRWKAMNEFTASLPKVSYIIPQSGVFGKNTLAAVQQGGLRGIIFEIEGYFNLLKQDNPNLICIITGGAAPFLVNQLKIDNFAEPYLVLKGLNTILNYQ